MTTQKAKPTAWPSSRTKTGSANAPINSLMDGFSGIQASVQWLTERC